MLLSGRTVLYLHGDGHENNGCKLDFEQIKTDESQSQSEPHHLSSYISVCDFSSVQFHLWGGGGRVSKYFALKTPQAHSRCLVASCFVVCPSALLLPGLLHHQKKKKKRFKKQILRSDFNILG